MTILTLDLDGKESFADFLDRIWILKGFGLRIKSCAVYGTKNGFHVYLDTSIEIEPLKALFMQLALGSDYRKEVFSFLRLERGYTDPKDWSVLFSIKYRFTKMGEVIESSKEEYNTILSQKLQIALEGGVQSENILWTEIEG